MGVPTDVGRCASCKHHRSTHVRRRRQGYSGLKLMECVRCQVTGYLECRWSGWSWHDVDRGAASWDGVRRLGGTVQPDTSVELVGPMTIAPTRLVATLSDEAVEAVARRVVALLRPEVYPASPMTTWE